MSVKKSQGSVVLSLSFSGKVRHEDVPREFFNGPNRQLTPVEIQHGQIWKAVFGAEIDEGALHTKKQKKTAKTNAMRYTLLHLG